MTISCPKNALHNRFETVVTVQQVTIVNRVGEIVEYLDGGDQLLVGPQQGNEFLCRDCFDEEDRPQVYAIVQA